MWFVDVRGEGEGPAQAVIIEPECGVCSNLEREALVAVDDFFLGLGSRSQVGLGGVHLEVAGWKKEFRAQACQDFMAWQCASRFSL